VTTRAYFLIPILCAGLWAQTIPPHTPHFSGISNGTVLYGAMGYAPAGLWPAINNWIAERFDWVLGGPGVNDTLTGDVHSGRPTKVWWSAYKDMAVVYPNEMYTVQRTAQANAFVLENMLLHSSVDMQYAAGRQFTEAIGQFDAFEPAYKGYRVGGVFTYAGGAYTDRTHDSWLGTRNTVIADQLYIGYMEPFDLMDFTIQTARVDGSVEYRYWNGTAWNLLPMESDATAGLRVTGRVHFHPPADWAACGLPVNVTFPKPTTTTNSKFWVRITVSGASTAPAYSTLKGDNWSVSSTGNNARGWSATDSHRINVGTRLEYNSTPPANASARFRYQARLTNTLNQLFGNPSDIQNGTRTWGRFLTDAVGDLIPAVNYDSAFLDDALRGIAVASPANASQYFDFNQISGWNAEWAVLYSEVIARFKSIYGPEFRVGINGVITAGTVPLGEFNLMEAWWSAPTTMAPQPGYTTTGSTPYDLALPANNPNGTKFLFQCTDKYSVNVPWSPSSSLGMAAWHYADHANRTPLMCLAMHYLGTNEHSAFMYNGAAGSTFYVNTDQVLTYLPPTALAADLAADDSTNAKTIALENAEACAVSGYPEVSGIIVQIGSRSRGDTVLATFGTVIANGTDVTAQSNTGYTPTLGVNTIAAGYSSPFHQLKFEIASGRTGGSVTWTYWNGSAWQPLTLSSDGTVGLTTSGTITFSAPGDWTTTTVNGVDAYWVRMSMSGYTRSLTYTSLRSSEWKTLTTTSHIYNTYPKGTPAHCVQVEHLSNIANPRVENVFAWTRWFPAMGVEIGSPDANGMNGGKRLVETAWKRGGAPDYISGQSRTACADGTKCPDVWRRDFTNAVVLFRPWRANVHLESELDTPSQPIELGGRYYPLKADGSAAPGITSVTLRGGEGAILMKSWSPPVPICDAGPQRTFRAGAGFSGQLDGSGSHSQDGGGLTYSWRQLSGPSRVRWTNRSSPQPTISGLLAGTYTFQLMVQESAHQSATCEVKHGAVATTDNGVVVTTNTAAGTLLGPLTRLGTNPWPWFDNRQEASAKLQLASMDEHYPAWWDTPSPGTVAVAAGSAAVRGEGTSFTTTFCQGPEKPTMPKPKAVIAVWYATGIGEQTGRRMSTVSACQDDTHLTVDEAWDQGTAPAGTGLQYAADDASTNYASNWGWGATELPGNYEDNVAAYYALYYRSGVDDYLEAARKLADRFWRSPMLDRGAGQPGRYGYPAGSLAPLGLVLRALELQGSAGDMWPGLHRIWDRSMAYLNAPEEWDGRQAAYHLAMASYCALFDADAGYRANCKASVSSSFSGIWSPSRAADGSWPQLYYNASSWDTETSASLVNGSMTVTGNGTAWSAGNFPATIWFTNVPGNKPANNQAGDATAYTATFIDPTHLSLDRPYAGTSGQHGWALAGAAEMIGWGAQPRGMGMLAAAFDLAAKAMAGADPANEALAREYALSAINWIRTYGYWPLHKGLYRAAQGINCQAPIGIGNTACTGDQTREEARAAGAGVLKGVMAAYAASGDSSLRDFADTLYNAMFAKPGTCPNESSTCVPDDDYLRGLDDGGSMLTALPPQGNRWFGTFFGFNNLSAWPAYREEKAEAESNRTFYVSFNLESVRGAAKVSVRATEPSGVASETECTSSPCAVVVDARQGRPFIELNYLSATGAILARDRLPL
jgi:hypothetical protein